MGHPHASDDIETQQYFHVPGQDLVLGRRRNSNECFGACTRAKIPCVWR